MTQCREMLDGLPNSMTIVDANIGDTRHVGSHVHEDERHFTEAQAGKQGLLHAEGENSDAIDAAFNHSPDSKLHAFGIVNRGSEKNLVIVLDGDVLERLHDLWEKWIGDFGNDEAKDTAFS